MNTLGLELVKCWDAGFQSAEELANLANIADTACNEIESQSLILLRQILPTSLALLADVSHDSSSPLLQFVSQLISLMKRYLKARPAETNAFESISIKLIQSLIMKLKYEQDEFGDDCNEETNSVEEIRFVNH